MAAAGAGGEPAEEELPQEMKETLTQVDAEFAAALEKADKKEAAAAEKQRAEDEGRA